MTDIIASFRHHHVKTCRIRKNTLKIADFVQLLPLIPPKKNQTPGITVRTLCKKFYQHEDEGGVTNAELRNMQRYVEELRNLSSHPDNYAPILEQVPNSSPPAYWLSDTDLVRWFMTEQIALNLLLAAETLKVVVNDDVLNTGVLKQAAVHLVNQDHEAKHLWSKVRVARSGIGREAPKIAPRVLKSLLDAVCKDRQVHCRYTNAKGVSTEKTITVQGLVLKDDTLYVLSTTGLADEPVHLAAHRIGQAEMSHKPAQHQPGFDLDTYIRKEYQLSHRLQRNAELTTIDLCLRIRPDYLYHFKERPLDSQQQLTDDPQHTGWQILKAKIPETHMLKQFLQSMGPGVEVLSPSALRQQMADEIKQTAHYYRAAA